MTNYIALMGISATLLLSGCGSDSAEAPSVSDPADASSQITAEDLSAEANNVVAVIENIAPTAEYSVGEAKVVAAVIHADWCGKCKTLDPKIKAVQAANPFSDLAFVTLDFTAKDDVSFFEAADTAGVGAALRAKFAEGVKTGQVILVDLDDQTVADTLTSDMSNEEIVGKIKVAVEAA